MLSVGSRDGRKGLGLGFGGGGGGGGGGEMEETELEEGEACYYHDNDDASIDPDIALSYIDEKLQDVLGHFQKDFEGGVSAENLGAKFGGYGSFLPSYQRSPSIWPHPRTPQKVQNYSTPRSPKNALSEGTRQNSIVPPSAPLSTRIGPGSVSAAPPPVSRVTSVENVIKRDACLSAQAAGEFNPRHEPVNRLINPIDQKSLKVRIKVGSDNILAQNNAAIYSGLGLDISPSSSLEDDSPAESRGMSHNSQESPDESPMSILQIMTSFPAPGALLLSPLPDSLLCLIGKEKILRDIRSGSVRTSCHESYGTLLDGSPSIGGDGQLFGEKKVKSMETKGKSVEVKIGSGKEVGNDISPPSKREIDIQTPAVREIVSNSLKLPNPSNSKCASVGSAKGTAKASDLSKEANTGAVQDLYFSSDLAKEEALELISGQDMNTVEKWNGTLSSQNKVLEAKKTSSHKDVSFEPKKGGRSKGGKSYDPFKADSDVSKGRKDFHDAFIDLSKQRVGQKDTPREQNGVKMPHVKEHLLSGTKKKLKGSQINGIPDAEFPKESLRVDSSAALKDKKKSTHTGDYPSQSMDDANLQKELWKTRESYKDFHGDINMEQVENRIDTPEMHSKNRPRDSKLEVVEKEAHSSVDNSKERLSSKKLDSPLTSEAYPTVAPSTGNGPVLDSNPVPTTPVVIKENWVGCDRCHKWRLLPYGTNPKQLPKKWLCTMLNWLPGMNRCNISEEETTRALNALYQIPVSEGQQNLNSHPSGSASGVTLADMRHLDQNHQDLSLHSLPCGGKKKYESSDASNAAGNMASLHFLNSSKKNQQASVKSRNLNDVNQSPLEFNLASKPGSQHLSKSSDLTVEKHRHKQKMKHNLLERYSEGGDVRHAKTKSKREADQEGFIASKKTKKEDVFYTSEDWKSDHCGALGRVGPSTSSGFPTKVTGKEPQRHNEYSSKDSKCDTKNSLQASVKTLKDQVQDSLDGGALDTRTFDKMDVSAKRKVKEWQESENYLEPFPSTVHHLQDNCASAKEETCESERQKEKKARVSKSEKESSTNKYDSKTEKKGRVTRIVMSGSRDQHVDVMEEEGRGCTEKDQQLGQYRGGNTVFQRTLDGIDSVKRDLGYGQPSIATTSSSSKVSGSLKNRTTFQEAKGSPVESVSSSPLRISNPDKLMSAGRNLLGKDDKTDAGVSVVGSPRRCSDGEGDGGSDRSGTARKDNAFHGSFESSVLNYKDRDTNHTSVDKAKARTEPSSEFENTHCADSLDQHNLLSIELQNKDHGHDDEGVNNNQFRDGACLPSKSQKGSSSRSKDKHRSSKSDFGKGKIKVSDSFSEQEELYPAKSLRYEAEIESHDRSPYHEETRETKYSFQERSGVKFNNDEKNFSGKKVSTGKLSSESSRKENQTKFGEQEGLGVKLGAICKVGNSTSQQNLLQNRDGERSSNRLLSDKIDRMGVASGREKSQTFPNSRDKQETHTRCPRPISGSQKESGTDVLPVDTFGSGNALKAPKQPKKPDYQNGSYHGSLRHPSSNGLGVRELDASSPVRKDSSSQVAANALKEAKDLKHSADRLKNSGLDLESTGLYFQAALKFLHGASLLEPCNSENAKHMEMTQSMQVYSDTAKLCEFCAHEYERCKDMATSALAYKCMEVAYMRVIYSKHSSANKDRQELQTALQMVPPGESPSSSASDVDNLNNHTTLDKIALAKGISSPQVAGNHVIVARNRLKQLLSFAHDINSAMEASRKSQNAFAAANINLKESQYKEGISSVKRVLDFNFQDVEGLLRLVRLAMEDISR